MAWYNILLNEAEMQQLSDVFNKEPFSSEKGDYLITAYINFEGKKQAFMSYDGTMVTFYHSSFRKLPEDTRVRIQKELRTVKALEKIVN